MNKQGLIILCCFLIISSPLQAPARTVIKTALTSSESPNIGKPAPQVKLTDINNTAVQLGGESNRVQVILSVVTLEDKITRIEVHRFNLMAAKYKNAQFIVISQQTPDELRRFADRYKLSNLTLISDSKSKNTDLSNQQHSIYIIGKDGKLLNEQVVSQPNTLVNFQPIIKALSPPVIPVP